MTSTPGPDPLAGLARYPEAVLPLLRNSTVSAMRERIPDRESQPLGFRLVVHLLHVLDRARHVVVLVLCGEVQALRGFVSLLPRLLRGLRGGDELAHEVG